MAWWFRRHRDLAAGIAFGLVLGLAVVALFVFVFSEQAVDEPQIDQSTVPAAPAPAAPSSTSPKKAP
jgi:hypothetical protein